MTIVSVTKKDIDLVVTQTKGTEEAICLFLGIGFQYEYAPPNINFSVPYIEIGKKLLNSLEIELYDLFCDKASSKPKEWINELISGDTRNLIIGVLTAITSKYNVSLGIAIPAAALVIKRGMVNFCLTNPKEVKDSISVQKLLDEKKQSFNNK